MKFYVAIKNYTKNIKIHESIFKSTSLNDSILLLQLSSLKWP